MKRRDVLAAGATFGLAGLAGCSGTFETESSSQFTTVEDRAETVYYPGHIDGMAMLGMGGSGRYRLGLMYSLPHAFWNISARDTNLARVSEDVSAHLMATIWDDETGTVLPTADVSADVLKDGEQVDSRPLWPMLSQTMGYHFGDNVALDGDGTYTARLDVEAMQARAMGGLAGAFEEGVTVEVEFEHTRDQLSNLTYEEFPDRMGDPGAIEPMEMEMPMSRAPERGDLPNVLGTGTTGDADFVAFAPDTTPEFADDGTTYLAVSPRTPYNRYPLPFMSLSATLTRDGKSVYDDVLLAGIDPDLGYHYGAAIDGVESGDSLTVTVDAPPQISRHEGYETAFVEMGEMEMTV
ncbi:iron transporter [Halorussus litoreus]|uniref:iron transporter n=1 Tax=Halorussus litoreus TaxID=1710536 RepID=UPI000E24E228|nr:iron transporter [Halorussus litoreus]